MVLCDSIEMRSHFESLFGKWADCRASQEKDASTWHVVAFDGRLFHCVYTLTPWEEQPKSKIGLPVFRS